MSDIYNADFQKTSFSVTPRVNDFLEVFKGREISISEIQKINEGTLDLIIGIVAVQNYTQGDTSLQQVLIRTEHDGDYTLTENIDFQLNGDIFKLFNNPGLINRPRDIYISNLKEFQEKFQDSAKYGQLVACVYTRPEGQITFLSVQTRPSLIADPNNPQPTSLLAGIWPRMGPPYP